MKLNLCCGVRLLSDFVNVDKIDVPTRIPEAVAGNTFMQYDLNQRPWPWEDETAELIIMRDGLEHLAPGSFFEVMDEVWRVLKPLGEFACRVPNSKYPYAFTDPTHTMFFNELSFDYLDPEKTLGRLLPHLTVGKFQIISVIETEDYAVHFQIRKRK